MSGIIGHAAYAILASKAAAARRSPLALAIQRNFSSYLAGAYLGCDVQTLPAAICVDSGQLVGYGSSPISKSPITGGEVRPWKLRHGDHEFTPREIHEIFYGRSHLILGFSDRNRAHAIPLNRVIDYLAGAAADALEIFGPGHRPLAYVAGWLTHVIGDGLIKSVLDGLHLNLIDGVYTAANRPVQDLVTFNAIGIGELEIDWPSLLEDAATAPVELIQPHFMRCAERRGQLGAHFENGWEPDLRPLLLAVMAENRRYQRIRNSRIIRELSLDENGDCDAELSRKSGGLSYREMVAAADAADFRHALWQIAEMIADRFDQLVERVEPLQQLPKSGGPDWEDLSRRWSKGR